MKKNFILFFLLIILCFPLFGQSEFSLGIAPILEVPLGLPQFQSGMGGMASLEWAFWSFAGNFKLGLFLGGSYENLRVVTGDPINFLEGRIGPVVKWRPWDRWSFRLNLGAGIYQFSRGEDSDIKFLAAPGLGADFHLSPYFSIFAEAGYTYRIFSPASAFSTFNAALGLRLNLTEIMGSRTSIQLEKTEQYRVFPVSWAWYEHNPVAMVKITNHEPNAITNVGLSFFMDSYMSQPWEFTELPFLASGESAELPVTALFNEVMLSLAENVNANGEISIQYRSLGARKDAFFAIQMPIYNRNALNWDDDRRAAAFVSVRDSTARQFALYVAGAVESQPETGNTPSNVRYAAAMFEALRLFGINYVIDPASSYIELSENASALDSLNYPGQTLYYRGGDCDDLSILYCSLLEVLGIETAFITIPGHIYAAFNVGDSSWMANSADIIEISGRRWLPVEITIPGEGFSRAWRIGAQEWRNTGSEAKLYPMNESWQLYPSVTVPAAGEYLSKMPPRSDIVRAFEAELRR